MLSGLLKRYARNGSDHQAIDNRMLYVPASSLPYHISGYTTRTHEIIRALGEAGADVRVLTRPGYPWDRRDRLAETDDVCTQVDDVLYRHRRSPANTIPVPFFAVRATPVIAEAASREQVSVIHAASNHVNALPALLAARRLQIPFHYEMRGLWELTRASRTPGYEDTPEFLRGLALEGFVARHADRVFVISEQLRKFAQNGWGIAVEKFSLLPNCVNVDRFAPCDPQPVEMNTIGYAGSLICYEGLDTLIDAVYLLVGRGVDIKVKIVGDGEARGQLEEQTVRLGLSDHIRFLGKVPPASAREIIGRCSLVCIPRKPFKVCEIVPPIKLVEAMAMAKPVIVPDLPVMRDELAGNGVGWFFRAGDGVDLARVIELALSDGQELAAAGARAREYATTKRRWHDFVREALPSHGGRG